jgi:hypothetical protein
MLRTARPQYRRTSQSYSWLKSKLTESNSSSRTILQGTSPRILPSSSTSHIMIYNNSFPLSQVQTRDFSSRNNGLYYSPYAVSTAQIYSRIVRPLGPSLQLKNPLHQQISARLQSSDSKTTKPEEATNNSTSPEKSKVEEDDSRKKASSIEVKVAEETGRTTTNSKNLPPIQESEAATRIHKLVDSVGPTLRRVSNDLNPGDLLSVYGIVALIALIVAAPMAVR